MVLYEYPSVLELVTEFDEEERQRDANAGPCPLKRLENYLEELRNRGSAIPRSRSGKLNKARIAAECGIDRYLFYEDARALETVERYAVSESFGTPL
jgi:hypothetical protein